MTKGRSTRSGEFRADKALVRLAFACVLLAAVQESAYTSASSARQDRLVAQWDGIDNAGVGRHDPQATVWKDLKGDLDMTLTSKPMKPGRTVILR